VPDRALSVVHLGLVEYEDGLRLMEGYRSARAAGAVGDTLFLLEHPAVVTLGRGGKREHVRLSGAELVRRGARLFETDRGGDVTYHGPGQLVAYPIVDLSPDRRDVRRYVSDLEESMIRTAADFGVESGRLAGLHGVWLGAGAEPATPGPSRKLGAVGVHLSRWITSHGLAFNVDPDLDHFSWIVPCGIEGRGVTSLRAEAGSRIGVEAAADRLALHLATALDRVPGDVELRDHFVQVQVVRSEMGGRGVLALRRTASRGGFWQPVTGHVQAGEMPGQAARRELREETGLEVDVEPLGYEHAFLSPEHAPRIAVETAYRALAPEGFRVRLDSGEHDASAWLSPADALERFPFAGLRRGVELAIRGTGAVG